MKLGVVFTLLISIFYIGCEDPGINNPPGLVFKSQNSFIETLLFESTNTGEQRVKTLTVENNGTGKLRIESVAFKTGSDSDEFDIVAITDLLPISVSAGDSIDLNITFKPENRGRHKAVLIFRGNIEDSELTLEGVENEPQLSITPDTVYFESSTGQQFKSFTIENIGNYNLTLNNSDGIPVYLSPSSASTLSLSDDTVPGNGVEICPSTSEVCGEIPKQINVMVKFDPENGSGTEGSAVVMSDDPNNSIKFVPISANSRVCDLQIAPINDNVLDFGDRFIGSDTPFPKEVSLINRGFGTCTVNGISLGNDTDSAIFWPTDAQEQMPDFPHQMEHFESFSFLIMFQPTEEISYHGSLVIDGDDPDWTDGTQTISLVGNGVEFTTPVAVCDPSFFEVEPAIDNPANPVSVVTLDGSGSYDPGGSVLSYLWEKIDAPEGSVSNPRNPTGATTPYFVDLAGEHKLRLTVTNEYGLSDSCEVTAVGVTGNALHIELFWDSPGDLDLHFRKPGVGDDAWGTDSDCYWSNCVNNPLSWFANNASNPTLDRDDISGQGPENLNIDQPQGQSGQYYTIGAKNYSHSNNPHATVRIYCNGGLQFDQTKSLPQTKDFWYVANVEWTETNGCNITPLGTVTNFAGTSW